MWMGAWTAAGPDVAGSIPACETAAFRPEACVMEHLRPEKPTGERFPTGCRTGTIDIPAATSLSASVNKERKSRSVLYEDL